MEGRHPEKKTKVTSNLIGLQLDIRISIWALYCAAVYPPLRSTQTTCTSIYTYISPKTITKPSGNHVLQDYSHSFTTVSPDPCTPKWHLSFSETVNLDSSENITSTQFLNCQPWWSLAKYNQAWRWHGIKTCTTCVALIPDSFNLFRIVWMLIAILVAWIVIL